MAVISFKCPNCDGELVFEPSTQQYECPYCGSDFTQEQMDEIQNNTQPSQETGAAGFDEGQGEEIQENQEETQKAVVYTCPSCGAEIVTDETTAATYCYYCHNPVVLSGRVSGEFLPKWILPFSVDRKKAESMFLENVSKKKFVPKGFFDKKQIELLSGVYFPYWLMNWSGQARMQAKATKVRVWRRGDTEYTETRYYDLYREGNLEFPGISRNALKKANKKLVEGVQPYNMEEAKQFSMGYLSGFQAEKRDMEQEEFQQGIQEDVKDYAEKMLRGTVDGYTTVNTVNSQIRTSKEDWEYALVPAWVVTYRGNDGKTYYYAINGQTGKVCGELPLEKKKLALVSGIIFLIVFLLGLAGGFLI